MSQDKPLSNVEHEAIADVVLGPKTGGMLVWVRRGEFAPRASTRLRGESLSIEENISMFAALREGVYRLEWAMADDLGIEREQFAEMVEIARRDVIAPATKSDYIRKRSEKP